MAHAIGLEGGLVMFLVPFDGLVVWREPVAGADAGRGHGRVLQAPSYLPGRLTSFTACGKRLGPGQRSSVPAACAKPAAGRNQPALWGGVS